MKFFFLSKNTRFVEKVLNHTANILVLMLTFKLLTGKSVSFTLDNREILEIITPRSVNYSALQITEFSFHDRQLHLEVNVRSCTNGNKKEQPQFCISPQKSLCGSVLATAKHHNQDRAKNTQPSLPVSLPQHCHA